MVATDGSRPCSSVPDLAAASNPEGFFLEDYQGGKTIALSGSGSTDTSSGKFAAGSERLSFQPRRENKSRHTARRKGERGSDADQEGDLGGEENGSCQQPMSAQRRAQGWTSERVRKIMRVGIKGTTPARGAVRRGRGVRRDTAEGDDPWNLQAGRGTHVAGMIWRAM